ncbi:ribonuclease Y [Patescibacteria group bacterium]|nr:ribonuclease Y [Patescibacteria group bacterium]
MFTNPVVWVALLAGIAAGYVVRQVVAAKQADSVEQKIKNWTEDAESKSKEIILDAKERAAKLLEEVKGEEKTRKAQIDKLEDRVLKREEMLEKQSADVAARSASLEEEGKRVNAMRAESDALKAKVLTELERVASLSIEDAKKQILQKVSEEHRGSLASAMGKLENERREEIEKRSMDIITTAIQRYARSQVSDVTTSVFPLPSEDLKGKIIGREGRNIKALERATGVEIIMDESPEAVILSSYDPLRREVARMTLEKLIKDGRIQPAKIEERVTESQNELNRRMTEIGENAALEVGVVGLPKEIIQLVGRLHFRTSFGQNVLTHSIEMAHISGMIAAELGANVDIAKKGALLHDIGKAIDHEVQGTHVELGRKILQKYGVDELVIRAMESHHDDYPYSTPESYIVTAADILSAARPGARRGTVENYIKRLQDLEKIATSFDGVKNAYALSAGREIRVFVVPEKIDDFGALAMARNIANKIQTDMQYPGEIKVNVIREMRAVEVAR